MPSSCVSIIAADIWVYTILSDTWQWVGGTSASNAAEVYGTFGVYDSSNQFGYAIGPLVVDGYTNMMIMGGYPSSTIWSISTCSAGYFKGPGMYSCTACPSGSISTGYGATSCSYCPVNTWTAGNAAATSCEPCPWGGYWIQVGAGSFWYCWGPTGNVARMMDDDQSSDQSNNINPNRYITCTSLHGGVHTHTLHLSFALHWK